MDSRPVKQELFESSQSKRSLNRRSSILSFPEDLIELSDSDDNDSAPFPEKSAVDGETPAKKQKHQSSANVAYTVGSPLGFLEPPMESSPLTPGSQASTCKQFWKAGDYEGLLCSDWDSHGVGLDHVRVHPKFLHSNATSHKWALGAFAELLDNGLDEVCNGATYVNIDMLINKKDESRMLLIEDNGGGMNPDKLRQCMSLGYSVKGKIANTIGQYGNGFKTSTMRLGADVIVFSRSCGKYSKSVSQSIGLLSYTFLRSTGKEDIVVPILDYERKEGEWNKIIRSSVDDWDRNVDSIVKWSPYSSEAELLQQFDLIKDHGTRIIIYNLWEDDQGQLELDFESDRHDIQIRGVNRDEKNVQMAKKHPNSRHYLTYRHSLRSYASILYLKLPHNFQMILRGKDVEHHNVVNDLMLTEEVTYRPHSGADGVPKGINMFAIVTIGFVKDAAAHIDVQGFNVYHKNRLIQPFWRLWNPAGSDGRGVIGVLEANFIEPAHDKQGFERTTMFARLESKLLHLQRRYWRNYCHKIGYAPRYNKEYMGSGDQECLPDYTPPSSRARKKDNTKDWDKFNSCSSFKQGGKTAKKYVFMNDTYRDGHAYPVRGTEPLSPLAQVPLPEERVNRISHLALEAPDKDASQQEEVVKGMFDPLSISDLQALCQLEKENRQLKERLEIEVEKMMGDLLRDLQYEKEKRQVLEIKLQEAASKIEELNREQESLIDIFHDERDRRDLEEETLRKTLKDASSTIQVLQERVMSLENIKCPSLKK